MVQMHAGAQKRRCRAQVREHRSAAVRDHRSTAVRSTAVLLGNRKAECTAPPHETIRREHVRDHVRARGGGGGGRGATVRCKSDAIGRTGGRYGSTAAWLCNCARVGSIPNPPQTTHPASAERAEGRRGGEAYAKVDNVPLVVDSMHRR